MAEPGPRVLIMDDNGEILEITSRFLAAKGMSVVTVSTQRELRDALEKEPPDVAVLDLRMPEANGVETAKLFRDRIELVNVPIILYSVLPEDQIAWFASHILNCHYVGKAEGPEVLADVISRSIGIPSAL